jgi:predicted glutamine amidotransferase
MCGILGFASTEGMKNRSLKQNFFGTGFPMIAADRGQDSSGLALIENANSTPIIYKRALRGADFIDLKPTMRYMNDIEKYAVAIGHVRSATASRGNITDYNAHPFQYGHITLVHNGHIRNANSLPDSKDAQSSVDSAMVAFSMAKNGEKETLEAVEGGFVFVWWNSKTKTLNIARNEERPIHMAYIDGENSLFWASELTHLGHLLRYANIDEDENKGGFLHPEPSHWYVYDLKDLRSFEKRPFVKRQGRRNHGTTGQVHGSVNAHTTGHTELDKIWEEEVAAWQEYQNQQSSMPGNISKEETTESATSDSDELTEIRDKLRHQRSKDAKKAGVPTSRKGLEKAKQKLRNMGIQFQECRLCYPTSWSKYHNQPNRGSMIARMRKGGYFVEIVDTTMEQYQRATDDGAVIVECVNVRNGARGYVHVVGIMATHQNETYHRIKNKYKESATVDKEATKSALGAPPLDYNGPSGQKISLAKFKELTVSGCSNCAEIIEPITHEFVVWVGGGQPLCANCSTNPSVLESVGFPDHLKQQQQMH